MRIKQRGVLALPGGGIFQRRQQPTCQGLPHVPLQAGCTVDEASLFKKGAARATERRVVLEGHTATRARARMARTDMK